MEQVVQATVEIGGKERLMSFDFNAYAVIEKYDEHFLDLFHRISGSVQQGKLPRASDISMMVFGGLYAADETITLREVRSWLTIQNMNSVLAKVMEPFGVAGRGPNDLAPFVPTPPAVVEAAIKALDLQPGDTFIDLGAGDGRMIEAALAAHPEVKAIAVEMDIERCDKLRTKLAGDTRVVITGENILALPDSFVAEANKVFCYLLDSSNERIRPMLERALKPGSRVVSHHFLFKGWNVAESEVIDVPGSSMSPHPIYTYIR